MKYTGRPFGLHPHPAHWEKIRKQALKRDGYQCRLCNHSQKDGYRLECHHRHYENWGEENLEDVTMLCIECHDLITNYNRESRYAEREYSMTPYVSPVHLQGDEDAKDDEDEVDRTVTVDLPQWATSRPVKRVVPKDQEDLVKIEKNGSRSDGNGPFGVFRGPLPGQ